MKSIRVLHTADLHLDTVFTDLPDTMAAQRREEQRKLLEALVHLAHKQQVQLVLLSGDLFDSARNRTKTLEAVERFLQDLNVPVFIAPGNHDFYRAGCVYDKMYLPANVHLFRSNQIECVEVPELGLRVWGAAFIDNISPGLLNGFAPEKQPDILDILCIHGTASKDGIYNPMLPEQMSASNMDYIAMGHNHTCGGLQKAGSTYYLWPGAPMGRGFDEVGQKGAVIVDISPGTAAAKFAPLNAREYRILEVDITGEDPLTAIMHCLPADTSRHLYRIILTGTAEQSPEMGTLQRVLEDKFYYLELQNRAKIRQDLWSRANEATLRGAFLRKLRAQLDTAGTPEAQAAIEDAARWGIAALDGGEEVNAL